MKIFNISLIINLLMLSGCSNQKIEHLRISGFTQGTTYNITFENTGRFTAEEIRTGVESYLQKIDISLSVYIDSSVISKINRNEDINADEYFTEVFNMSRQLSEDTGGAFDITVGPLVRAWGFGPEGYKDFEKDKIDSLRNLVGFRKIDIENGKVIKSDPRISVDMNAIAQGYTVDIIYRYLKSLGMTSFLVEIGGEVRVMGAKGKNPWKIGIDKPVDNNNSPGENLQAIISLKDKSLATSGNYRKFYVEDGIKYSHTIDPATGFPAKNRLLSATIITDECAIADGVATACMVMGLEKSVNYISRNPEYEAYFIYSDDSGNYAEWISGSLMKRLETGISN